MRMVDPGNGFPKSASAIENSIPVITASASATFAAPLPPLTPALLLSLIANSRFCVSALPDALGPTFPAKIDPLATNPTAAGDEPVEPGTLVLTPPWRSMKSTLYDPLPLPQRENR